MPRLLPCLALLVFVALPLTGSAQRPTADEPMPVFRLSVSLVQLDAVVTDRKGRHVTTLGPEDFQVFQDGKPQPITAVAYVRADDQWLDEAGEPLPVYTPASPRDAGRVIALVVDDLRMSFGSIYSTRLALRRFVDEQLRADDLVTIITTSGARGTTWPFTFSRPELRAAAARLRFSLGRASASSVLEPLNPFETGSFELFREETFAIDALNRIADVVQAVRELPGRKTVVLVSEGFAMFAHSTVLDAMRRLVDRANRAGVVIYAVDPRGLVFTGLTAADSASASDMSAISNRRSEALRQTQDGLRFVAEQTGGFAVVNANDMPRAFRRVMDDQRGYYLVGYQPAEGTFDTAGRQRFRKIKIKVIRPGVRVRTRAGFYNVPTH